MQNIALHQRVHNHEDTPRLLSSVRAMVSIRFQERNWIFHKLMGILNCRDDRRHILAMAFFIQKWSWILHQLMAILVTRDKKWHIPAMAFFIQLLQYPDLSNELEDAILDQMSRQRRDPNTVVRWLALKGLLNLALHPEKALHNHYSRSLDTILRGRLTETPTMDKLQHLLEHVHPSLQSKNTQERARAVQTSTALLKFATSLPVFDVFGELFMEDQKISFLQAGLLAIHLSLLYVIQLLEDEGDITANIMVQLFNIRCLRQVPKALQGLCSVGQH
ncbi:uncharacterized protein LOC123369352 isoform X5 [Mauremys mutica]|uniref:uncharacterized protein LOC123369352 isoform X5 n=1 Tax=Mauremys mutica TaxID=74926 RepID=UPI001D16E5A3|nr:uncharacterized protein LOC123369352 isoform X5 [Mauremys mutica]